jgi:hypothetical protein
MNHKLHLVLAVAAGFAGGLLSHSFSLMPVFAQTQAPREIQAQSFTLVMPDGRVIGRFSNELPPGFRVAGGSANEPVPNAPVNPVIRLYDGTGREIGHFSGDPFRPLSDR